MKISLELVVKISEEVYEHILKAKSVLDMLGIDIVNTINAVKQGILLPKRHGELMDKKEAFDFIVGGKNDKAYFGTTSKDWEVIDFLKSIPTIIEVDKDKK